MKADEIKLRINNYVLDLIDEIFPESDIMTKLKATAAKYWIKQNLWRLDSIFSVFKNQAGEIDPTDVVDFFSTELDGKISISLQDISELLPPKRLVLQKSDLMSIFVNNEDNDD